MGLQPIEFVETKGDIVRNCPGTKHHICCGYKTIDLVEGCILSCSYCILKEYITLLSAYEGQGIEGTEKEWTNKEIGWANQMLDRISRI